MKMILILNLNHKRKFFYLKQNISTFNAKVSHAFKELHYQKGLILP